MVWGLKLKFIALLDIQKQAFAGDLKVYFHTVYKGRVMLISGTMERDVFGQLLFSLT
jgi:hypothetical protein